MRALRTRNLKKGNSDKSEATKRRLIEAGLDLFGRYGYDASTTRELAELAGANLASIPYHFGGKDALYRAVAHHVVTGLDAYLNPILDPIQSEIDSGDVSVGQALALTEKLLSEYNRIVLCVPETDRWVRFIVREQLDPTEAFEVIYNSPMRRAWEILMQLMVIISGLPFTSERVRISGLQIMGMVYMFRTAQATALRTMNWAQLSEAEFKILNKNLLDNAKAVLNAMVKRA